MDDDQETLRALEASVDRLRSILPAQPYIQTVPQDEPRYHHRSQEMAEAWLRNAPFDRRENPNLQYQTWFYHEAGTDLIYLQVHSQVEHKAQKEIKASERADASAASTPNVGPKKKISLAAYKDKKVNGVEKSSSQTTKEVQRDKSSHEEHRHGNGDVVNGKDGSQDAREEKQRQDTSHSGGTLKRKRRSPQTSPERSSAGRVLSQASNKRRRPSSPARPNHEVKSHTLISKKSSQGSDGSATLPNRLSPLNIPLPGRLSPLNVPLPDRLSPTLPEAIAAELDLRASQGITSEAREDNVKPLSTLRSDSKHDSVLSNGHGKSGDDGETLHPNPTTEIENNTPRKKPIPEYVRRERSQSKAESDKGLQVLQKEEKSKDRSRSSVEPGTTRSEPIPPKSQRLLVMLKIPRRLRQDWSRLLKFPPKPYRDPATARALAHFDEEEASASKNDETANEKRPNNHVVKAASSTATKAEPERRGRSPPSTSSARKRAPSTVSVDAKPMTPLQPAFQSPSAVPSAQKAPYVTPTSRKDLRGPSAMKMVESADRYSATPPAAGQTPVSVSSAGNASQITSSGVVRPSPVSGNKTGESQAWGTERERLARIGKDLKHAAGDHVTKAKSAGERTTAGRREAELAALTSIESFLAFMLSFYCSDMSYATRNPPVHHPDAKATWVTLHGFWKFVAGACAPIPALHGLAYQLGAVYNAKIMQWIAQSGHKGPENHDAIVMMSRFSEGARLELGVLKAQFPATWKAGCSGGAANEDARPGHYEGGFELPVGLQTGPLMAVRIACSMLAEYKCQEGGKFIRKLSLDG